MVLWARVSTAAQADHGTSLEAQLERMREWAIAHNQRHVVEVIEGGVSGASSDRPLLAELIRRVELGEVDTVVVTKLDRLARSLRQLVELVELFESHGVSLVALDDPIDPSTASGRAMVHLRAVFAEFERRLIVERMLDGQIRRVETARWVGGPAPYGYQVVTSPDGGRVLAINDEEAEHIRLMYRMLVVENATAGEVADKLNEMGVKPRRSPAWRAANVRSLLVGARGLSGQWPWRRGGRDGRDGSNEIVVPIPAILTEAEHSALNRTLHRRGLKRSNVRTYVLRGRVWSPCGLRMQGTFTGHLRISGYGCPRALMANRAPGEPSCGCARISAPDLHNFVWGELVALLTGEPSQFTSYGPGAGATPSDVAHQWETLNHKLDKARRLAAESIAQLLADGVSPTVASEVSSLLIDEVTTLEAERRSLANAQQLVLVSPLLASQLAAATHRIRHGHVDTDLHFHVYELVDMRVDVLKWVDCTECFGRGRLPGGAKGRKSITCPTCKQRRRLGRIRATIKVPTLAVTDQYARIDYELEAVVHPLLDHPTNQG